MIRCGRFSGPIQENLEKQEEYYMKVILLQDVKSLGKEGDVVNVSDGYARNFVIPKKLGVEANEKNKNDLKLKKQREAKGHRGSQDEGR